MASYLVSERPRRTSEEHTAVRKRAHDMTLRKRSTQLARGVPNEEAVQTPIDNPVLDYLPWRYLWSMP